MLGIGEFGEVIEEKSSSSYKWVTESKKKIPRGGKIMSDPYVDDNKHGFEEYTITAKYHICITQKLSYFDS